MAHIHSYKINAVSIDQRCDWLACNWISQAVTIGLAKVRE